MPSSREYLTFVMDLLRFHVLHSADVMKPVCQFYYQDPYIPAHGQEHLSQIFDLPFFFVIKNDIAQLCYAIDHYADLFAKLTYEIFHSVIGVFHDIMKQTGYQRAVIHTKFGQDLGRSHGMDQIRLSGFSYLSFVLSCSHIISMTYQFKVITFIELSDVVEKFLSAFHSFT